MNEKIENQKNYNLRFWLLAVLSCFTGMIVIWLTATNRSLFLKINKVSLYSGEALWAHLTVLGDTLLVIVFILPAIGRRNKLLLSFLIGLLLLGLLVTPTKYALEIKRPPAVIDADEMILIGVRRSVHSFPSGHTSCAFLVATSYALATKNFTAKIILMFLATLAGISRIAVGVHWPLDVLAGVIIGIITAIGGYKFAEIYPWHRKISMQKILSIVYIGAAILLLFHDSGYRTQYAQIIVSLICLIICAPKVIALWQAKSER